MKPLNFTSIHNQDPNNLHYSTKEPLRPEHVDAMIDNIAASGVDAVLVNSNAEVANHPSSVIGTYEDMRDCKPEDGVSQSFRDTFANDRKQYPQPESRWMRLSGPGVGSGQGPRTRSRRERADERHARRTVGERPVPWTVFQKES